MVLTEKVDKTYLVQFVFCVENHNDYLEVITSKVLESLKKDDYKTALDMPAVVALSIGFSDFYAVRHYI